MITEEKLQKAIAAHSSWKGRLRTAVSAGKFDAPPATVRVDNLCDFGKWLYGAELTLEEKQTEHYRKVKQLHAEFHKHAAQVVEFVTSGQKNKAEEALGMQGEFPRFQPP